MRTPDQLPVAPRFPHLQLPFNQFGGQDVLYAYSEGKEISTNISSSPVLKKNQNPKKICSSQI